MMKSIRFVIPVGVATLLLAPGCRVDRRARAQRYFRSGIEYFSEMKCQEAAIQFRNAVKQDPREWLPHYYLALSDLRVRRWGEAYRELHTVIELRPKFVDPRLELGDLLLQGNKTKEAREQIDAAQELQPANVRAQVLSGKLDLVKKDYPQAIEKFEKAKKLAPQDAAVWGVCGMAKLGAQKFDLAAQDFRHALELAPNLPEAHDNLANLYRAMGRKTEAEALLKAAATKLPNSLEIQLTLADFYFREKRMSDADQLSDQLKKRSAQFRDLNVTLGDFWMWRNDLPRAVKEFEVAISHPPDLLVRKKLISADITLGRWNDAERLNAQILAKDPKDTEGRAFQGALRHLRGDSPGAVEPLRAVIKDDPQSSFANYYLGLALVKVGKLDEAETAFNECIRINENFPQAFQQLAELHLKRQDWEVALEYSKKVISLDPQNPDGYLLLAQAFLMHHEAQKAEAVLEAAEKVAPDLPQVHELMASTYVQQGKMEAGEQEYERARKLSDAPVAVLTQFVDSLLAQGQADRALRLVQQEMTRGAQASHYEILAHINLKKGDLAAAEAACLEALKLDSSRWVPHFHLSQVYDRMHRPDEALAQYDVVIRRQPAQIPPYILAGDMCLKFGRLQQARDYYEAARRRAPDSVPAQHGLARVWAEEGSHLDEASTLIQSFQQRFPDDPYLEDTLGWVYFHKSMYPTALPLLKRCVEQHPENALFQYHLGMTYWKLGDAAAGRRTLQTAVKLGLDSAQASTAARQILGAVRAGTGKVQTPS